LSVPDYNASHTSRQLSSVQKYYQNHIEAAQSEEEKYNSCLFHYQHATIYGNNYINK